MTRRLAGAIAATVVLLTGLWLVLAPFALGIQPSGKDWSDETMTDVWSGIGLGVVGLVGLVAFVLAIRQHLVDAGIVHTRVRPQHAPPAPAGPPPAEPASGSSELRELLAPLIAALSDDMNRDRPPANGATGAPSAPSRRVYGSTGADAGRGE
ncbi:MAG: hypothetical protein ACRDMV_07170 [Streptosporangiales bacterium]